MKHKCTGISFPRKQQLPVNQGDNNCFPFHFKSACGRKFLLLWIVPVRKCSQLTQAFSKEHSSKAAAHKKWLCWSSSSSFSTISYYCASKALSLNSSLSATLLAPQNHTTLKTVYPTNENVFLAKTALAVHNSLWALIVTYSKSLACSTVALEKPCWHDPKRAIMM
jgi:hypothetical protein